MKKIDFHIHTVKTAVDAYFEFDLEKLKEYVQIMAIDGIAITNHNQFDRSQYETICNSLEITVLPGIEINVGKGHAILITDKTDLDDFSEKCARVAEQVKVAEDFLDIEGLKTIFGNLSEYLIIPHYDKHQPVDQATLEQLGDNFYVGEVASAKKFMYAINNSNLPTPVLFSDARAKPDWEFKSRQTFVDVNEICVRDLKLCFTDKSKVSLSKQEGNALIQVTPGGINISTGLTVVLGGRSSGKSRTLDEIYTYNENVKYIRQFELIETEPDKEAEKFNDTIGKKRQDESDKHLRQFHGVVDEIKTISLANDEKRIEEYVDSLKKFASETERHDLYSKTVIFNEKEYEPADYQTLKELIVATEKLLQPGKYSGIVEAHVNRQDLVKLLHDLVINLRKESLQKRKQEWVNSVIRSTKRQLGTLSAVNPISDVNFLEIAKNRAKVARFETIVKELQKPRVLDRKTVRRFTIEETNVAIKGAQDLKSLSGKMTSFMEAFSKYVTPYEFLLELMKIEELDSNSYYRFFTKIEFRIINEFGVNISGGERAEFKLVQTIDDAIKYDMLLIDEPESSFDNLFLSNDVNSTIKDIAENIPVVVVTHNNTIGASIKPNYLLFTERTINDGSAEYRVYTGLSTDKNLKCISESRTVKNADVTLKYLEAGKENYEERRRMYEMLED